MIVKVQRSITTSHKVPQILVYNKPRTMRFQFDADSDTLRSLPLKSFWKAHVEDDELVLDEMVLEREW